MKKTHHSCFFIPKKLISGCPNKAQGVLLGTQEYIGETIKVSYSKTNQWEILNVPGVIHVIDTQENPNFYPHPSCTQVK